MLSICIPNYNRLKELEQLINTIMVQIKEDDLYQEVELCISDDCSSENPTRMIETFIACNAKISIKYCRNDINKGMDFNFLQSVLMASKKYVWIIGNDDVPEEHGIKSVLETLKKYANLDFLVAPFDTYGSNGEFISTIYPFKNAWKEELFITDNIESRSRFFKRINGNTALFDFLSNVVFKRENWIMNINKFSDKMNTIFIQVYYNMYTFNNGSRYLYSPIKFIKQYNDEKTNETFERNFGIVKGLHEVVDFFFDGDENRFLHNIWVDIFVSGKLWETEDEEKLEYIKAIPSDKINLYNKCYVKKKYLRDEFQGKNVVIYGGGKLGQQALVELRNCDAVVKYICDSEETKHGQDIDGIAIQSPSFLLDNEKDVDYIVVANRRNFVEIVKELYANGINKIKVIN